MNGLMIFRMSPTYTDTGENKQNLFKDKIKYYLNNPLKREAMAKVFHEKWVETCGPKPYWEQLFKWSKD